MQSTPFLQVCGVVMLLAAPTLSGGELRRGVDHCAALPDAGQRLSCFEALRPGAMEAAAATVPQLATARIVAPPRAGSPRTAPGEIGKWLVQRRRDPMSDTDTVTLWLPADRDRSAWGTPITLRVRCGEAEALLEVDWQVYLGADGTAADGDESLPWKRVRVRLGVAPAEEQRWQVRPGGHATAAPLDEGLARRLAATVSLSVQVRTGRHSRPITATFDTAGFGNVLRTVPGRCRLPQF